MDLREQLGNAIALQGVEKEQEDVARAILSSVEDEDLELLQALVESPTFGWDFVIRNVEGKKELFEKNADDATWNTMFVDETIQVQKAEIPV